MPSWQTCSMSWETPTPIDISQLCTLASTTVRLSQRLGLERKQRDVTPSLSDLIRADQNRGREETRS